MVNLAGQNQSCTVKSKFCLEIDRLPDVNSSPGSDGTLMSCFLMEMVLVHWWCALSSL